MSLSPPKMDTPALPAPLPPVQQPQGSKPKQKSMMPSFLGAGDTPGPGSSGQKTLLGQ